MKYDFNFTATVKLYFGAGKLKTLHTLPMPGKKALVVISNGKSTKENGSLDCTLSELQQAGVAYIIYNKVNANPTKECVEEGGRIARENACDFIVALGGGSVLDAAKVMALSATNPGDLWNYVNSGTGLRQIPKEKLLPWIAIPTTAGTGSEADAMGVISNLATKEKLGIAGDFATYAIVDPELMMSVPPRFTAYQGFDALFHSLEGHISNIANPMADMVQEQAIRNVGKYLPRAYKDGSDMEARTMMAFASTMSGYSMVATSCTAEHSIEHALSAYHESLPHGAGLIMICKAYFSTIIRQGIADERLVEMAKWLGKTDATIPEDFLSALGALMKVCDVDNLKMSDYGIRPEEFDDMATNAMTVMERCWSKDIQPLTQTEIVNILKESYR